MSSTLGQYFTTDLGLKNKVYEFILNKPECILEPSIGRGDLVLFIKNKMLNIIFDGYEIDESIKLLDDSLKENVIYTDFLTYNISKKYDTIIGNPPYVKIKKGNLYIEFIKKCYNLLNDYGELIFIVPSDFFKLTTASKLLNIMLLTGNFTHVYHPHNENLFDNASIDVLVFRYNKTSIINNNILYNDEKYFVVNNDGMVTFEKNETEPKNNILFKDYFNIYVGLVSGKEEVYKNENIGNITLVIGENKFAKYICINKYPSSNSKINDYLLEHKQELINRRIRKFNENNWFEWGALRNITAIKNNKNMDCIYIHNLTRKDTIAFIGKVGYFNGNLLIIIPKEKCNNLNKIVSYLNSNEFKKNFIFSGRFKIGHRQISNSILPSNLL
jgi:adenine-specific DNA-methyltransferase